MLVHASKAGQHRARACLEGQDEPSIGPSSDGAERLAWPVHGRCSKRTRSQRTPALEALHHRDFRLLWTGQTVSLIGDGAFLTALGWKTFTIAGSGRLGVVLLCNALGLLTTLLIGGALGDRLSRKGLMIASDFWRFGAVAILAGADATGHLSFELLVVLATLVGLGDGFFYPAFGGMVPLVVDPSRISSANSLIGVSRWTSLLIGPALAAGPLPRHGIGDGIRRRRGHVHPLRCLAVVRQTTRDRHRRQ